MPCHLRKMKLCGTHTVGPETAASLAKKLSGICCLRIARKLLQAGTLDIKTIADMTELTEEEVRVLQTENDN